MQINRLFQIIYILLENKVVTAKALAERFNVSVRTIYRDIENLSSVGVPVYMSKGKGGGISILPDFVLNKALLTQEEKQDILSSIRAVSAVSLNNGETLKTLSVFRSVRANSPLCDRCVDKRVALAAVSAFSLQGKRQILYT